MKLSRQVLRPQESDALCAKRENVTSGRAAQDSPLVEGSPRVQKGEVSFIEGVTAHTSKWEISGDFDCFLDTFPCDPGRRYLCHQKL